MIWIIAFIVLYTHHAISVSSSSSAKFGRLHSLQAYSEWAVQEEKLETAMKSKLSFLYLEKKLVQHSIKENKKFKKNRHKENLLILSSSERKRINRETQADRAVIGLPGAGKVHLVESLLALKHSYQVVKGYASNLNLLVRLLLRRNNGIEINNFMIDSNDLFMSMTAILHIQDVYMLLPEQLSFEMEIDSKPGNNLSYKSSLEIALFALSYQMYYWAMQWLEFTRKQDYWNFDDMASSLIYFTAQQHNIFKTIQKIESQVIPEGVDPLVAQTEDNEYHKAYLEQQELEKLLFTQLCLGNNLQTAVEQISLHCRFEQWRHPYLYINPVKMEVLSESPPIFQFYEIMGNNLTENIIGQNIASLEPSTVAGSNILSDLRTSVDRAMEFDELPKYLYFMAEIISGLKIIHNSEATRFVAYSWGRYYTSHRDPYWDYPSMAEYVKMRGDRMATMLYYLEIPDKGGYTPFLQAGIYPRPVKGSAILWYNFYRNGTIRDDVIHGSCPVLHGQKIIMNHWILSLGNWNTWKCSLNRNE